VIGRVRSIEAVQIGGPPGAAKAVISDGTGLLTATWFRQSYLVSKLVPGTSVAVSGRAYGFRGRAQMDNPEYEVIPAGGIKELTHAGNLLPIYPSAEGLPQRTLRTAARRALDQALGRPPFRGPDLLLERLPETVVRRHGFPGLAAAVENMHFPHAQADRDAARRRLAFDELFTSQIAVLQRKAAWRTRGDGVRVPDGSGVVASFLDSLDYQLTGDQGRALDTILGEMAGDVPMGRLLQGEVGSGKTVVALAAMLAASAAGFQGALMAPTEVLAEQHFIGTVRQLGAAPAFGMPEVVAEVRAGEDRRPVRVALLIGSLSPRTKAAVQRLISGGDISIVIGTHALLQEGVAFPRLALAVIDEQHRFGVEQRAALTARKPKPHMLALSATPIPRTLSLTVYGDLELSTLRQLPEGRRPIQTSWARSLEDRSKAYELVRTQAAAGRQAFVVCPLIEPSEEVNARAAVTEFERLQRDELAGLRVGLLHGRMSLGEKQLVMDQVRSGAVQVLVATPVIEVGVDIPNAAVMLIESADRFGLAQLHQFRGRVGRSEHASYCVLLSDDPGEDARARLSVIARVSDGFELAEEDLRLRGPGDYIGTRQSGWADLKVATFSDVELLTLARHEAADLLAADPALARQEHSLLAAEVTRGHPENPSPSGRGFG
jgi:ATP-dependent DNA helicase RecG